MGIARCAAVLGLAAQAWSPSTAWAQDEIGEAQRLFEGGDFQQALDRLAAAERGDALDGAGLERLLELQAVVLLALDRTDEMEQALRRLAVVAPDHRFGGNARPELTGTFDRVRRDARPPAVDVTVDRSDHEVELTATVEGDPSALVREVRLAARTGGEWSEARWRLALSAASSDAVEYYAEARGPGGAVVARRGSPGSPIRLTGSSDDGGGDRRPLWPWFLGGGVGVAIVVIALAAGLAARDDGNGTFRIGRPRIE